MHSAGGGFLLCLLRMLLAAQPCFRSQGHTLSLINGKYKRTILYTRMEFGVVRFNEMKKYIGSKEVRAEKRAAKRTLGETLKAHRIQCHMTQEFVAESLGVSRQTVSKWENGSADPSTTNLLAVAKLYDVPAEELLREVER